MPVAAHPPFGPGCHRRRQRAAAATVACGCESAGGWRSPRFWRASRWWGRNFCRRCDKRPRVRLAVGLRRQPHPTHHILEPRLSSKGVPYGIHLKEDQPGGALLIGAFEPLQGLVIFAEPGVNEGNRGGGKVSA